MKRIAPESWLPRGVPNLEPAAMEVVRTTQNALVVAGPGSGKTELLAQRASFLLETGNCATPYRILAISFKRDAARNLRERVGLRCGPELARRLESYTFDAWAKGLLDRFRPSLPPEYRPTSNYVLDFNLSDEGRLQSRFLAISAIAGVDPQKIYQLKTVAFYRKYLANVVIDLQSPTVPGKGLALIRAFWDTLLHSGRRSVLNFHMIGALAELILRTNPTLLFALRTTYRFVFLDEFQDTTTNQFNLLSTAFLGSPSCMTAVGDNKQRIMLWAGAHGTIFEAFLDDFHATRHSLTINYRSAPRLIAIQNHLIAEIDPTGSSPMIPAGSAPDGGECRILTFATDDEEGTYLGNLIATWVSGENIPPEEICVLVRQTPDRYSTALREALAQRGIFIRVQDAMQDLLSEPLTRAVLSAIYVCCKTPAPDHWIALREAVLELQGLGDDVDRTRKAVNSLSAFVRQMRTRLGAQMGVPQMVSLINEFLAFLGKSSFCLRHEQYMQAAFLTKTISDCATTLIDARSRRASWGDALDDFMGVGYIPVMSIHKSKGLEYHSVVFLGLEDYPFRSLTEKNGEEECNVFVAFSRAKERVIITSVAERFGISQGRSEVEKFFALFKKAGVNAEVLP